MTEFSTIKFFSLFEEAVQKYNTHPITEQNLVIQQDAYKRLADHHEDDEDSFEVFASLECSQKIKDTALRFAVEFTPTMFMLHIEGADAVAHRYQGHFKNEQTAVDQIMAALIMLSNGQISCLLTERQGTYCASEVVLVGKNSRRASVLAMNASYPWSWRKSDEEGYDTFVLRNTYIDEQVAVPKNFFLIEYTPEGTPLLKGRELTTGNYTPLTKKLYDETSTAIGLEMAGKKENESEWSLLYRSWETWVITALVSGLVYWGYTSEVVPAFIRDLPFVVVFWPLSFVVGYVSFFVLGLKGYLRQMNPNNPWARLDDVLAMYAKRGIAAITSLLLLVTTFWPLYVLKGEKEVVDIYHVASAVDVWWIYSIPALFVLAALGAFVGARKGAIAYVSGTVAGVVALIAANFMYTNSEADTPEPYTTIAILLYLAAPVLAFVLTWRALRGKKADEPVFEYDGPAHNQENAALQNKARPNPDTPVAHAVPEEQAVIVEGVFVSGEMYGTKQEQDQLYTLEDQLEDELADTDAELDGNEIGGATFTLFLYGSDADALFATIEPILKQSPFKKLKITKRYGPATDEIAKEKRLTL